ncbi:hypothetical protein CCMSSC00406_0003968 [Pleurotus cornucopiae]|uniref:Uncharacterized protein n=1 Tax=Pleurotus cornucopiae TaxID=5321 RepID=A0ACB7IQI0_PLECO|nr:hypothetical protein CCMSSC00406_0003968 [Pleurotus cornucopiae]
MRNLLVSWCLLLCTALLAYAAPVNIDAIDKTTYDNLVKYAKFAAAAYETNSKCKKPLGLGVDNGPALRFDINGTQGYLVIDDKAKEVILSFEGTFSPKDILTDIQFWRTALKTASYSDPKASVHAGFQKAWLAIEKAIMDTAARFVKEKKGYKWTIVGHSLGGAIAEYASLAIKAKYPDLKLTEYTYGAPRAGNDVWVKDLEKVVGANNIYRGVHVKDIVPTMLGHWLGYKHPGTEYWQFKEPSSPENVKKCQGGEDPSCSSQYHIAGLTISFDHMAQFGVSFWTNPLKPEKSLCPVG